VTTSKIQVSPTEGEDFSSDTYYKEYETKTGKTRKLVYGLFPGEAMWQLRVESLETLNSLLEEGRIKK
jgi:hypothetical protein